VTVIAALHALQPTPAALQCRAMIAMPCNDCNAVQ
jgi:hypothetical protein